MTSPTWLSPPPLRRRAGDAGALARGPGLRIRRGDGRGPTAVLLLDCRRRGLPRRLLPRAHPGDGAGSEDRRYRTPPALS